MRTRLRQVALVARNLWEVEGNLVENLGLEPCVRDFGVENFGLRNVIFPVGNQLLEVVSPFREDTPASRFLDRRGGDGGYMVLVQVDNLAAVHSRLANLGVRVVFEAAQTGIKGLHLHPQDIGGAILSVDETDRWEDWPWAGENWRDCVRTTVVSDLAAVEIQAAAPEAMAARWAAVLGVSTNRSTVSLDEGELRFVPLREESVESISGLEFRAQHSADLVIGGVHIALRPI